MLLRYCWVMWHLKMKYTVRQVVDRGMLFVRQVFGLPVRYQLFHVLIIDIRYKYGTEIRLLEKKITSSYLTVTIEKYKQIYIQIEKYKLTNFVWYCGFLTQDLTPSTPTRFQNFAFSFHWKRNESIASIRSFSDRFARPHGHDENAINLALRMCRRRYLNQRDTN